MPESKDWLSSALLIGVLRCLEKRNEMLAVGGDGFGARGSEFAAFEHLQFAKAPRIDKAQLASRGHGRDQMSMFCVLHRRFAHNAAARHSEMDYPLRRPVLRGEVGDDVLADAAEAFDSCAAQHASNFLGWRFQQVGFIADPNLLDAVSGEVLVQAARDGFHLGQLGHGTV